MQTFLFVPSKGHVHLPLEIGWSNVHFLKRAGLAHTTKKPLNHTCTHSKAIFETHPAAPFARFLKWTLQTTFQFLFDHTLEDAFHAFQTCGHPLSLRRPRPLRPPPLASEF